MHTAWHHLLLISERCFLRHIVLKSSSVIPTHNIRASDQWNLVVHIKADTLSSVSCGNNCPAIQTGVSKVVHGSLCSQVLCWQWGKGAHSTPCGFPNTGLGHHCKDHPLEPKMQCSCNPHHVSVNSNNLIRNSPQLGTGCFTKAGGYSSVQPKA